MLRFPLVWDLDRTSTRREGMDRRAFLGLGLAALPALAGMRVAPRREPLALATADTEAHVVVVSLGSGRVVRRLHTTEDPRSIESGPGGHVVVAHSAVGAVSLLSASPVQVRRVLRGLGAPRYTAIAPDGAHAFVTDGERGELLVVDLRRARIVAGVEVGAGARHVTLGDRVAFVASGDGGSVRVHDLADGRVRHVASVPLGSYNVQAGAGAIVTPSLASGRLTILDRAGRVPRELKVARAAHDACGL